MAVKPYTVTRLSGGNLYYWDNMTESDTAAPVYVPPGYNDKTFFCNGAAGGGTIGLLGSLDPAETDVAEFAALTDPQGSAIALSDEQASVVAENMLLYAPGTPTGSSVDLNCWLLVVT